MRKRWLFGIWEAKACVYSCFPVWFCYLFSIILHACSLFFSLRFFHLLYRRYIGGSRAAQHESTLGVSVVSILFFLSAFSFDFAVLL
jgi:hypothetical protein